MKLKNNIAQKNKPLFKPVVFLAVIFLLLSCDWNIGGTKEPELPPVTEILGFEFSPSNNVSVGDILTITCIVKDNLRKDLRFIWGIGIHASQAS